MAIVFIHHEDLITLSKIKLEQNESVASMAAYFKAMLTLQELDHDDFVARATMESRLFGKIVISLLNK